MSFQGAPLIVLESSSREEWLEQRRSCLTATDMATLYLGGPKAWERIAESKHEQPDDFDNQYMRWGREREPVIAGYINMFVDSTLRPNDNLILSSKDQRFAATPDMISTDSVGDVLIGEIKTSKHDLTDIPMRYIVQMQWQMLVCESEACVFAWEQHEDFVPMGEPKHQLVYPDREMQSELMKVARQFFDGETSNPHAERWGRLLHEWRKIEHRERSLRAAKESLRAEMESLIGDDDFRFKSDSGAVSYTLPKPRETFDTKGFREAHPELYAEFVKTTEPKGRTLRVTLPKDEP